MIAMTDARIEAIGGGRLRVHGALTFATVRQVLRAAAQYFDGTRQLEIDLSGVGNADSAGLALLVEWYRQMALKHGTIRFVGAPEQLRSLAAISEVDQLLALEGAVAG